MKNNEKIKIGYLVAYDYEYLKNSLPTIYPFADQIILAIDINRKTWAGQSFDIPIAFFNWITQIDVDHKIKVYEDEFAIPGLASMESEVRARNMLAKYLGNGGWHIQIDVDEFFVDFGNFIQYLKSLDFSKPISVFAKWITIFKQENEDFFLIEPSERFPLATNLPFYVNGRLQDKSVKPIYTDFAAIHQSWGRSYDDMQKKLTNWSHKDDFITFENESYFSLWRVIDKHNYKYIRDFHPLYDSIWLGLTHVQATDIDDLIRKIGKKLQVEQEQNTQNSFFNRLFRKKNK